MRDAAFELNDALSQALQRALVLVDLLSSADPDDLAEDTRGQAGVMIRDEIDAAKASAGELYALAAGGR